jgi:hypothetical protein
MLVRFLRAHPEWTLAHVFELAPPCVLEGVRIGDLFAAIDPVGLARAQKLSGDDFDACVLAVIREAQSFVNAGYLRARVGGPRWKLQSALGRLAEAGAIQRSGTTSATRYWSTRSRGT